MGVERVGVALGRNGYGDAYLLRSLVTPAKDAASTHFVFEGGRDGVLGIALSSSLSESSESEMLIILRFGSKRVPA